ncbi:ABC transporter ATP-binding protein [Shimia sp. R11_0]|uniref:ABC transporter transmembrane domain-containing protein n=1 Tax=Shimia sp. R11_0 TaxID=2821096 RepID=UPI001ADB3191|nr:ABC transporter transmembrane domain-containing protein [Shimia sp. R11_0]MBO9477144.1 ABC transporter ATP-binding protein [Shimia sp. R11_0]
MLYFYKRIWKATGRVQMLLVALSLIVAALAAVPLQFQKDIINSLGPDLQMEHLLWMCAGYFAVIVVTNLFKFVLNYRSSLLGEATIRRIRTAIYDARQNTDADLPIQTESSGTVATIIAAEAEEVGKFVGQAVANPLVQVGTLVSVISFVASTQPYLGAFLVAIVVPQALIVFLLQEKVNRRVKARTLVLRRATGTISDEALSSAEAAAKSVMQDFDEIYTMRRGIFKLKLSMKFAMNVLSGIGLVGILMIGGLLMMQGRSDIGTVVAALSALDKINGPWRLLLGFYKELSAVRVKFDLIVGEGLSQRA